MSFTRSDTISHRIGPTGRFGVGLVDGEIRIRAVEGDEARAVVHYEIEARSDEEADRVHQAVRIRERRGEGILELDEPGRDGSWPEALARLIGGGWRHARTSISIDATVPIRSAVRVRGVTAEVRIDGTAGDLELRSVSGDVSVAAAAGSVTLDTVSGAARVAAAGTLALRARTVSGDLVAAASELTDSRLVTVSGDVEIEAALGPGEHRVETASGDLRLAARGAVSVDVTGIAAEVHSEIEHRLEGSLGHRRLVVGDGGPQLRFRTMSGSLLVTRARPLAPPTRAPSPVSPPPAAAPRPPSAPPPPVAPAAFASVRSEPGAPTATREHVLSDRMAVLRAVERGELDVDEALHRLGETGNA